MRAIDRVTYLTLALVLLLIRTLFQVQAASPTPDGCYPNFATAMRSGWGSPFSNTTGNFNTSC